MIAEIFGIIAAVTFIVSSMPMVVKAVRTRDLRSYSAGNLILANVGNGSQTIYLITGVPFGPLWLLHGFNTTVSLFMLVAWFLWKPKRDSSSPSLLEHQDRHGEKCANGDLSGHAYHAVRSANCG